MKSLNLTKNKEQKKKKNKRVFWWLLFFLITYGILVAGFTPDDTARLLNSFSSIQIGEENLIISDISGTHQKLAEASPSIFVYLGLLIYVALIYGFLWCYLHWFSEKNKYQEVNIILLGILMNSALLLGKVLALISIDTSFQIDYMLGLLMPSAGFAMLVAALIHRDVAFFTTILVALCYAVIFEGNLLFVIMGLVGGVVGIIQVAHLDQRSKYAKASLNIFVLLSLTVVAWGLIWGYSPATLGVAILLCGLNGILSLIVAVGVMPFLESAFDITTVIRYLELSNSNNPLLKQLMTEAPGTYQHSVLVGNLAESAALEVGANSLVCRVGSLYHDIGKLKRPDFFIENTRGGENPHDKLQPNMSFLIITSHTKEGLEMAKENKLPKPICDIIVQHHGTTLVKLFYDKARQQAEEENAGREVKEADFRYPGPKPQTKEAAIVMLADSTQAAIQSMRGATSGQIEGKIREIIKGKFNDGQLEECDLTFKDLDTIATVFSKVLAGVNHKRLSYPKEVEKQLKKDEEKAKLKAEEDAKNAEIAENVEVGKTTETTETTENAEVIEVSEVKVEAEEEAKAEK